MMVNMNIGFSKSAIDWCIWITKKATKIRGTMDENPRSPVED